MHHDFHQITQAGLPQSHHHRFNIPPDSGRKTYLARAIIDQLRPLKGSILCLRECGVWSSSANHDLLKGYRISLDEYRDLTEAPFHIAEPDDTAKMESLLSMVLHFIWGCTIINHDCTLVVNISHDEYIEITTADSRLLTGFIDIITN